MPRKRFPSDTVSNEKYKAKMKALRSSPEHKAKIQEQRVGRDQARANNAAERKLAQRELCRRNLIAFVIKFNPGYLAGWVHKDICRRLEQFKKDVEAGLSPRLMLQMPPRHGKSQIASQDFPAWVLGEFPKWEFIVCSYSQSLALDFSRTVRGRLKDPEYCALFKTRLSKERQNAEGWLTTSGGGFLPAGVGGAITGKGANILIIDDPVKNAEEADSQTNREGTWKWYTTTAYTRLAPGAGVLVIQTRWHDDDLSGKLEREMVEGSGDTFEIVRYPAQAEENEKYRDKGDALHSDRYPLKQLERIKKTVGPRTWSALYQQNPTPDDGAYIQRSMIRYYRQAELPDQLSIASAWDLAISEKEHADWTAGITAGLSLANEIFVLDGRRGRWDANSIVEEICDNFIKHDPYVVGIEKGQISLTMGPLLEAAIREKGLWALNYEELPPGKRDKIGRARTLQGLMRQGKVWLPHPDEAPWVEHLVNELLRFPYGVHDDWVDAFAWLAIMMTRASLPGPTSSKLNLPKSWREKLTGFMEDSRHKSSMSS